MRILITGASGFIGSALARAVVARGHEPVLMVRDRASLDPDIVGRAGVLEADICCRDSLYRLTLESPVECCVHCAASLDYFGGKGARAVNIAGCGNMLEFCRRQGVPAFVLLSSIEAVGPLRAGEIPGDEDTVCRPVSGYGGSKLIAERESAVAALAAGMRLVVVRLGNVYGPGRAAFVGEMAVAASRHGLLWRWLPLIADRTIHPLFIDDAVEGILKAAEGKDVSGVFVLAGSGYVTLGRIYAILAEEAGLPGPPAQAGFMDAAGLEAYLFWRRMTRKADFISYVCAGGAGKAHRAFSTGKAARQLGFSPRVGLEEGIRVTVDWMRSEGMVAAR